MRALLHTVGSALLGLVAATALDAGFRFVRLGVSLETASWACALSAIVAAGAGWSAEWVVARRASTRERAKTTALTALWGIWLAVFCVRSRWGWISLERFDAGVGPPAQLSVLLFPLVGASSAFFARYLARRSGESGASAST